MSHEKERPHRPSEDAWHAHLDSCQRCEQNPFDLCRAGADLLIAAGNEVTEELTHAR